MADHRRYLVIEREPHGEMRVIGEAETWYSARTLQNNAVNRGAGHVLIAEYAGAMNRTDRGHAVDVGPAWPHDPES
jgi:hypothetical protein